MKKIFVLVFAAMIAASMEAKVIMTESFEQEVGTLNVGPNTSMGTNTSDWWSYSGSSNYIKVEEGTLSYPGYKTTGAGNKAFLWSTGADDFRQFAAPVTSGKIYAGATINVNALKQGTISDYFLCFGDATASNMYARLYAKSVKDNDGNYIGFQLGVAKYTETNTYVRFTKDVYSPNTNYLVVLEYEFVEGTKNDIARLYVNPTKANTQPTLECVQDTVNGGGSAAGANSKNDASKISSIDLRQGTNTPKEVYVDEIKVTTTWTELFEDGGEDPSPAINVTGSVDFGNVTINEPAEKTITVKGSYLKGAINVTSSSALVVPAVSSISKDDAEASSGYALKLTLTATETGEGSANITLSSTDATSQVVSVTWTAATPAPETLTIAEVKAAAAEAEVSLNDVVIIRVFQSGGYFAVQDASGALNIADYYGLGSSWKVGDKLTGIAGIKLPDSEFMDGFCTIFPMAGSVASSGNAVDPFDVSLAEIAKYGPALVRVNGVTFPEDADKFAAGYLTISQSGSSVQMQIPAGCDIIGEDVPASADVIGLVCHPYMANNLILSKSADMINREPKGGESGGDNLILNHSFEEYSCNAVFGCSFDDWDMALGSGSANSTDKIDGNNSLMMNPTGLTTILDQGVALSDADYATGTKFTLTLNYKVQTMPEGQNLKLDCYWEAAAGGDSEAAAAHDSVVLRVNLENGSGWMQKELTTTKPVKTSNFRVRVKVPKGAKVLFDNFSLYYTPSTDPYIEVSPTKLNAVQTTIGNTATFQTVHIRQGNLSGKTTFYVGGKDASQFSLSASELPADKTDLDLIITYAPTSAGTHSASLIFDNAAHTTILPDMITLSGSCTDPSAKPTITVTPSTLPDFEVLEGKQQQMTVTLSSMNCTDFVYARVDHISPIEHGAFTIDGTMYAKNSEATVTITFSPTVAGTYQSTITFSSVNAESVVVTLNGTGTAKMPETIDWQTDFVWNLSNPLNLMNEQFEDIKHNETLILNGWQNVAAADQRPWWGFDASKTQALEGEGKFAKASAYQFGQESTGKWEMWLVTPPLDYKNAGSKVFTFSVMGQYLASEGSESVLEVYYIDATNPSNVFRQDLTSSFDIPSTSDVSELWRTFFLDLAPYSETIADVFFMAFRFTGPNGNEGAVTYYIDNVSWGRTDLPLISVDVTQIATTAVPNEEKVIGQVIVSTQHLTAPVDVAIKGANYNKFKLSSTTLPAAGGTLTVTFQSNQEGVHEAYVELSSSEAPTVYIPLSVLCQTSTGFENIQPSTIGSQKIIRNGMLLIRRNGMLYDVLGTRVK